MLVWMVFKSTTKYVSSRYQKILVYGNDKILSKMIKLPTNFIVENHNTLQCFALNRL